MIIILITFKKKLKHVNVPTFVTIFKIDRKSSFNIKMSIFKFKSKPFLNPYLTLAIIHVFNNGHTRIVNVIDVFR